MSEVITGEPCPCCGDIALPKWLSASKPNKQAPYGLESETRVYYECRKCGLRTKEYQTQKAALQAWNTRVERTCEIARVETGEPAEYDCDEVLWHCESCHEEVAIYAYNENGDTWADKPAFCPNCGAKVVE